LRYLFSLEMMEENYNTSETDDLDFYDGKPAGERWAPLGANDLDDESTCYLHSSSRYVCLLLLFQDIQFAHIFQYIAMIL